MPRQQRSQRQEPRHQEPQHQEPQHQEPQHEQPSSQERQFAVGDRVRAKITNRTGEVTQVVQDGATDTVTVSYDGEPQDDYLTTPAREGAELPRTLVDPA
ncbi:MAG: hypothetical protein IT306_20115 [Chloroflexi bacterium]|nr:hypothetical protein [Chloroflexota bacterium]